MFDTWLMKRLMSRALHLLWRYVAMKGMLSLDSSPARENQVELAIPKLGF